MEQFVSQKIKGENEIVPSHTLVSRGSDVVDWGLLWDTDMMVSALVSVYYYSILWSLFPFTAKQTANFFLSLSPMHTHQIKENMNDG
jgi:hypothetical protein